MVTPLTQLAPLEKLADSNILIEIRHVTGPSSVLIGQKGVGYVIGPGESGKDLVVALRSNVEAKYPVVQMVLTKPGVAEVDLSDKTHITVHQTKGTMPTLSPPSGEDYMEVSKEDYLRMFGIKH